MPIDKHGFLGEEIEKYRQELLGKFGERFAYYKKLNRFLNELKFKLTPQNDDAQRIAIVTLFIKALETFQATYVLASYGLTSDAEILNRALFETVATILYISKGQDNFKRYLAQDLYNKLKLIRIVRENPNQHPNQRVDPNKLTEAETLHRMQLKELGNPPKMRIEAMIRETEIAHLYDPFYRSASGAVHSTPFSLEKYILDQRGKTTVMWGPRDDQIDTVLSTAVEFMLIACKCLSGLFGNPKEEEIVVFNSEKESIWLKGGKE